MNISTHIWRKERDSAVLVVVSRVGEARGGRVIIRPPLAHRAPAHVRTGAARLTLAPG